MAAWRPDGLPELAVGTARAALVERWLRAYGPGSVADLKRHGTIFIDELYADKLAITALGQTIEMHGKRARVVGLASAIRSFTL